MTGLSDRGRSNSARMGLFEKVIVAICCIGLLGVLVVLPIRVNINALLYLCAGIVLAAAVLMAVMRR